MKSAQEIFDEWQLNGKGERMAEVHWPRVSLILNSIPKNSGNYLEIGVGTGYALEYIAKNAYSSGQCYGLDISTEMINECKTRFLNFKNVTVENGDFLQWNSPKEYFNVIFSMEVFYYFSSIKKGINKAFQLLKKGGELWILVDFYQENETCHLWPDYVGTPMKLWSKDQYKESFKDVGFSEVKQGILSEKESSDGITLYTYGKK